ncbi:MAG: SdrD B-like domain-containing protein [Acidobacteriota bacterium]
MTRSNCSFPLGLPAQQAIFSVGLCLLLGLTFAPRDAAAQSQTFFVPMTVEDVRTWADVIQDLPENDVIQTVISITATTDETVIYYDHWEDGFEPNITLPLDPFPTGTTQIWGDSDCSNGFTPTLGTCSVDSDDVINAGDILVLEADVPANPRDPTQIFTDPSDKIATTQRITVTTAAWPSTGVESQLGGAVETFPTSDWGLAFRSPVGEDLVTQVPASGEAFEFVAFQITSQEDGTVIAVDLDADGATDTTLVLDEGQVEQLSGVDVGATLTVTNGAPIQAHLLTANAGTTYEGRWYSLVPTAEWDTSYYSPVGATAGDGQTQIFLHNPGGSAITIRAEQLSGCTDVVVPAGETREVALSITTPTSAARFLSDGLACGGGSVTSGSFFAVGAVDRDDQIYDWGFTLIPQSRLTPSAVVGWAPGSNNFTENASPVWVTAVDPAGGSTTLYVDLDGDPATGPNVDPIGNRYDLSFTAADLESIRVNDLAAGGGCGGGDCDQTGMRIYTVDGTQITAAWGQDPSFASSGQPQQLDMGTTVLPAASLASFKEGTLLTDLNNNGGIDVGDTLLYTIRIVNTGIIPIDVVDVSVIDTLDVGTDYVAGSTQSDGNTVPDDALLLGGDTVFPLDADTSRPNGYTLQPPPPVLEPGEEVVLTFQVVVNNLAVDPIVNQVAVTNGEETFADSSVDPLPGAGLEIVKSSNAGGDVTPGQTLTYTIDITNASNGPVTGVQLVDALPTGTTYVAESTSVTGPRQIFVADRFRIARLDNNNGPDDFLNDWDETDVAADSAVTGEVQLVLGELRITNNLGGPAASLLRSVDLSEIAGDPNPFAHLSFDFRYDAGVDTTDALVVEAATSPAGPFTVLETFTGLDGDADAFVSGGRAYDISAFIGAQTTVRFRVSAGYTGGTEFFYIDDFEIRAVGDQAVAAQDDFTSFGYSGGTGWAGAWVENDLTATPAQDPSAGAVQVDGSDRLTVTAQGSGSSTPNGASRTVDLSGHVTALLEIQYDTTAQVDFSDFFSIEASESAAGPLSVLEPLFDDQTTVITRTYDLTPFISSTTTIRFRVEQNYAGSGEFFRLDQVRILAGEQVVTTKNNVPGGGDDLVDGVPSLLMRPADSFALAPTESLSVTFQVVLDDPLALTRIINSATATTHEQTPPVTSTVSDPVSIGGTIGDRVWLDVDGDGVQDVGEPGISGVTVELRDGVCTPSVDCPTMTTDANGGYLFDELPPGTYTVFVDTTTLPAGGAGLALSPGLANPSASVVITAEERVLDVDFGFTASGGGVLGDFVWHDTDGDGVQDAGELGLGGVVVDLIGPGADGVLGTADDVQVATTTTDADGSYLFTGVAAGDYFVQLDASNFGGGAALDGLTPTSGPQSIGGTTSDPVAVTAGSVITQLDFGYVDPARFTLSDVVWLDRDGDGVRDVNEEGIAGVTVDLFTSGGVFLGTSTTGPDGTVSFSGLENGDYELVVSDNAGVLSALEGTTAPALAGELPVTIAGANVSNVSFGYSAPGVVGDVVWSDADGDGVQDPGEPGIAGVTVDLQFFNPGTLTWDVVATTTTGSDGAYRFENLPRGSYRAVVTDTGNVLTGFTQTGDPSVVGACGGACDGTGQTLVDLGTVDLSLDFGYQNSARPDVSGTVFEDDDRDGLEDVGELGITGVQIALVTAGPDGVFGTSDDVITSTTTTDANGDYVFTDVPAGDYRVAVRDGEGSGGSNVLEGYTLTSGLDELPITVAAADITDLDFGYARGTGTGSIGDQLWIDVDPPGPDGPDGLPGPNEPPLPGVTVELYLDVDGDGIFEPGGDDGAAIASTVTDADGRYLFDGLDAGRYFVDVDGSTLPTNLVETTYPAGVDPSAVVALTDGARVDDVDFGYVPAPGTAILGDFVWYDADGDGLQDPGEAGIGGVTLDLFGAGPDGTFGTGDDSSFTTTTAADGSYLFTGLPPDEYFITFDASSLPAGVVTAPTNLPPGETTYQVTAAAGDVFGQLDFGFDGGTFGSIGDRVWLDQDGDGVQDAGEGGLENVTVNLLGPGPNGIFGDADDEILATTTTGTDGAFDFVGLPAGDYRVDVTDLDGVLAGLSLSGGTDPTATIALAAGQDFNDADFGYAPAAGTGSIGSTVWHDLDFDGVLDPGEPPIQGVTVDVWLDVDGDGVITPGVDNLVRRDVTDTTGAYEVKALPFGDYLVSVSDTAGVLSGFTPTVGPSPGTDGNSQSGPYAVTLGAGTPNNITADFGYRDVPAGGSLSIDGTVFLDDDVDAFHDEPLEGVVESVEILLYRIVDGTPLLVGRTRTDVDGNYSFGDLPPGDYELHVDTTATGADGFLQTTQTTTGGIQPVTLVASNSSGNDFGFFDGGVTTTPVTLSFLHAEVDGDRLEVSWQTVTEVGHIGFHLWLQQDGAWRRIDNGLIASSGGDSISLRSYRRTVALDRVPAAGAQLMLEDVDIFGRSRFHGPFPLDRELGRRDVVATPIDWSSIRATTERLARLRLDALSQQSLASGGVAEARLIVQTDGVYRVTYEQLAAAGVDFAGVRSDALALTRRGVPVPIHVGGVGATFGPGGTLDFVGAGIDSLATRDAVYRLTVDAAAARRMAVDASVPAPGAAPNSHRHEAAWEREREYSFAAPNGDPWFDTALLASGAPARASFPFTLEGWTGADPVRLLVDLWGVTDFARSPDHHVVVRLNGAVVADERFDGLVARTFAVDVPAALLTGGVETLEITVPGDTGNAFDLVHVDGFRAEYPRRFGAASGELAFDASGRVFEITGLPSSEVAAYRIRGDVTGGATVERLTGLTVSADAGGFTARIPGGAAAYRLVTPAALRSPAIEPARPAVDLLDRDARLLIIAHADFVDGIERLADRRRAQGWTARVVDLADVYAAYSGGIVDPQALRDYLADAAREISTEAVLLVGGDTYDPLDHLGLGAVSFVPSLYAQTGDIVRFAPSDGLYADIDGDEVPDLAIGRFPVRTTNELEAVIDKTIAYEALADRRSLVLAADGYDAPTRFDFTAASEQLARRIPAEWSRERILLDQESVDVARPQLLDALDRGPALTSFMGHSGPTTWTFDGLFSATDAAALGNTGRPTVVSQWGCWTTYYVSPAAETLAHELLLAGDHGAAAVLGAATLTEARSERALALEIYSRLFEPGATLGGAVLDAKRRLAALEDPAVLDVLLGWTLLGDPTLGGFDGRVDNGLLFQDGFESGSTNGWSQTIGAQR